MSLRVALLSQILIGIVIAAGTVAHVQGATTYYVAPGGDDQPGKGTNETDPFETIQYAINQAGQNDTVLVKRDSLYAESIIIDLRSYLTLGAYGSGADPVVSGTTCLHIKNSHNITVASFSIVSSGIAGDRAVIIDNCSAVTMTDLSVDASGPMEAAIHIDVSSTITMSGSEVNGNDTVERGFKLETSMGLSFSSFTIRKFKNWGVRMGQCANCTFTSCTFTETVGQSPLEGASLIGHGVYITGAETDNISFTSCTASNNWPGAGGAKGWGDGISCNSEEVGSPMSNITLTDCILTGNGRQGLRAKLVDTVTVTGGEASYNGATGIQIETDTRYATIDDVDAIGNGVDHNGEAGIWIDESYFAIIKNCFVSSSTWGIIVSQSDTIDIDTCYITGSAEAGIRINTGAHYYHLNGGSPAPNYPGMQEGGVRNLTICANCFFSNNNAQDILYGDARLFADDENYMIYYNNEYQGSSATIVSLEFDLIGGGTGYVANKLEDLQ